MEWKKDWKQSKDQAKQRKYRENAPQHLRKKFLVAPLSQKLQKETGLKRSPVREGDEVEVMRGDFEGMTGEVTRTDYEEYKIYADGIEREKVDGTKTKIPLRPSNVKIMRLHRKDRKRFKRTDLEPVEEEADEEEEEGEVKEEAEEAAEAGEEETAEETEVEEAAEVGEAFDPSSITSGTVAEAKEELDDLSQEELEAVLEAEKDGKDRKTLKEAIERKLGGAA